MSLPNELILLAGGLCSGLLSGLLGAGGGVFLVPMLVALNYEPIQALGTSCLAASLTTISASMQNARMGYFSLKRVLYIGIPAVIATQISVRTVSQVPPYILLTIYGTLSLILVYFIDLRRRLVARAERAERAKRAMASNEDSVAYEGSESAYIDKRTAAYTNKSAVYTIEEPVIQVEESVPPPRGALPQWLTSATSGRLITGILAGTFAGFAGGGAGSLLVPLQMLLINEAIKVSIQTSIGVNAITSTSAWMSHASRGNVLFLDGFLIGIGGFAGAQFGTRFLPKLPDKVVSFTFITTVATLSSYILWRAWLSYKTLHGL